MEIIGWGEGNKMGSIKFCQRLGVLYDLVLILN